MNAMSDPPKVPARGRGQSRGRGWNPRGRPYFRKRQNVQPPNSSSSNQCTPISIPSSSWPVSQSLRTSDNSAPYPGWKLYFPNEEYDDSSPIVAKVKAFSDYINDNGSLFPTPSIVESRSFSIDLKLLLSSAEFCAKWPDFKSDLIKKPEETLGCLGLAMHQEILGKLSKGNEDDSNHNLGLIWARVRNFEPISSISDLKSVYYGKLVSVKGTVIRVGQSKLMVSSMAFECRGCSNILSLRQIEGILSEPTKCPTTGCRATTFIPLRASPFTITNSVQQLRLQDEARDQGRVPPVVDVTLTADLTEKWCPGDVVVVTGIVKISAEETKKGTAHNVPIYIKAVSVTNSKSQTGSGASDEQFNLRDYYAVKEIHAQENLFRLLVHSLNPGIYGHEMVKAGLLLAMFGGSERENSRSDPHVLVVGDPGLGKSQMLQACANIAPKGVYVCGHVSTTSGLTLTVKREGGDHSLEAGALVMADEGVCCIDEFDKMTNQHFALLDAMEDQKVSIAKHGVVCSMPARCSVLAAANPVGGHYNKAKTVSENLKLGPALLSRFDLVFILLDQPDTYLDGLLAEHVMGMHSGHKTSLTHDASYAGHTCNQSGGHLQQHLKLLPGEKLDCIPTQLIRKYIAYAKKYVKPQLCREAALVLQDFFLELRRQQQGGDSTPVTTRQLESLIRLTEARAKLQLRVDATAEDARDVIEIFKTSLADTLSDDAGVLDISRSIHGSGMSSRNKAKNFVAKLQKLAEREGRSTFSLPELKDLASSLHVSDFSSFLESLNIQGFLLKKSPRSYRLVSAD